MADKTLLADLPDGTEEEISFLYRMGIGIEELEYIIRLKSMQSS